MTGGPSSAHSITNPEKGILTTNPERNSFGPMSTVSLVCCRMGMEPSIRHGSTMRVRTDGGADRTGVRIDSGRRNDAIRNFSKLDMHPIRESFKI